MRPTVSDEKLHIDSSWLGKKNNVQRILYEWNVNFERTAISFIIYVQLRYFTYIM